METEADAKQDQAELGEHRWIDGAQIVRQDFNLSFTTEWLKHLNNGMFTCYATLPMCENQLNIDMELWLAI